MSLVAGTKLEPYEILSPLGAGGMGEVEPSCGREPFGCAQGTLRGSPQAKSRALRGILC